MLISNLNNISIANTNFLGNKAYLSSGGALFIVNYNMIEFRDTNFTNNFAVLYGGAILMLD